jgi:hypothetical protein
MKADDPKKIFGVQGPVLRNSFCSATHWALGMNVETGSWL